VHDRTREPARLAVLASGGGSNLQALIDAHQRGDLPCPIVLVISNHADAGALSRAAHHGIAAHYVSRKTDPDPSARILELPYEGDRFSMVFVLPEARHGLAELERGLDLAMWESFMAALQHGEAIVAVPRFEVKLEPSLSLVGALQQLGVTNAFDPALADFTGMAEPRADRGPLVVGNILHQAFLRVDESGTEAAAATAVVVVEAAAPAPQPIFVFRADEPFLFALRDRQSGMILFLGRVTDPR